jgi:hypothetical protein
MPITEQTRTELPEARHTVDGATPWIDEHGARSTGHFLDLHVAGHHSDGATYVVDARDRIVDVLR